MIDNSSINLFTYFITWVITLGVYYKKKKQFDAGALLISSFILYSFCSLMVYKDPSWGINFKPITLFPFIYLFLMLLISFYPILKYDSNKIQHIQNPSNYLIKAFFFIYIISAILYLPSIFSKIGSLTNLIIDNTYGLETYNTSLETNKTAARDGIYNLPAIIYGAFEYLGVLFFFYYQTLKNKNKLINIALAVCVISVIFATLLRGERGGVFYQLATIAVTYLLLKKQIPKSINLRLKKIGIILGVLTFIFLSAITISRFGNSDDENPLSSIYYYLGNQNITFNNYGLDNNGLRYGDRTFPFFKILLGFSNVPLNFWERREKYPELNVNDEVFISYVGDFTLDYGPIIALILFILFFTYAYNKTIIKNNILKFHRLILIHFISCICIQGGVSLFTFGDIGGNIKLIMTLILYITFKLDYNRQVSKKQITLS